MTQVGSRALVWDLGGRLTSTTLSGTTTTFAYDGLGNRAQQTTGSQVVKSLWDASVGPPLLALERDGSGQTLRSYTHGLGLVSMLAGSQQHYFHGDALGSSSNLTSASGATEWTYGYEPYGVARTTMQNDPSAPANLIRFGGEYLDDAGLYNLRARMYDPSTGRFASRSPLPRDRAEPTVSGYSYGDNRPTTSVSPNGMTSVAPPATEGCGPGITRCSLMKLANTACPPPMFPYGGLPGFKQYWLDGYYGVCEGMRAMLRAQLGQPRTERDPVCEKIGGIGKWGLGIGGLLIRGGIYGAGLRMAFRVGFPEGAHWFLVSGIGAGPALLGFETLRRC